MSITNLTRSLVLALVAALLLCPSARAQHALNPFIDPMAFNPDYQFFAPAELGEFGNVPDPNTGWFAEYNRMYIYVTRPEGEASFTDGDFTWGNRIDIGYMTEENRGWWITGMHVDGPNRFDSLRHPRVNRDNTTDRATGTGTGQQNTPVFPTQDRNNILTGARDVDIRNSLNVADLSGFEINHVWRLDPLHSGGTLEPFMGLRYMKVHDNTLRESYRRLDPTGISNPLPNTTDLIEEITSNQAWWDNHMFGGQIGLRWVEYKSRWKISNDVRMFAVQNFQEFANRNELFQIRYSGVAVNATVVSEKFSQTNGAAHASEFVFGTDVRSEAAFELTRDISLNFGLQFMHFAQGIARGNNPNFNEEDLTLFGGTFGVAVNR